MVDTANATPINPEADKREALKERLAIARLRSEETQAKREALEDKDAFERKVLKAEQEVTDQEALLEAESEHGIGKVGVVETDMGIVILKRCNALRYKKFQDLADAKTLDVEKLIRPCVIYPDKNRFDAICEELPATVLRCGNCIAELAGIKSKDIAGK